MTDRARPIKGCGSILGWLVKDASLVGSGAIERQPEASALGARAAPSRGASDFSNGSL